MSNTISKNIFFRKCTNLVFYCFINTQAVRLGSRMRRDFPYRWCPYTDTDTHIPRGLLSEQSGHALANHLQTNHSHRLPSSCLVFRIHNTHTQTQTHNANAVTPASKVATLPEPTNDQSSVTVQKEQKYESHTTPARLQPNKIIQEHTSYSSHTHTSVQDSESTQNAAYTQRSIIRLDVSWD